MATSTSTSSNPFPVEPTGFLLGSYIALILYGLHLTQLRTYFAKYTYDPLRTRLLVLWVFVLSTFQVVIIVSSGWKYFVGGLHDGGRIWGEFWEPLSIQDGLIPLMAMTAQFYFGRRAWQLWGRRTWIKWLFIVLPTLTMGCGIALAVTARIWSADPFVSRDELHGRPIGTPSQVVAILWMGLSAFTDGCLTLLLVTRFVRSRSANSTPRSSGIISRLIALTLETVLLTHIVGAAMCVIFLASPPATRTQHPLFWILLEIITELYALSILFTINARHSAKDELEALSGGGRQAVGQASALVPMGQTALDRHVEGYQGSTPFGVRMVMPALGYEGDTAGYGYLGTSSGGQQSSDPNSSNLETPYTQGIEGSWPNLDTPPSGSKDKLDQDVDKPGGVSQGRQVIERQTL